MIGTKIPKPTRRAVITGVVRICTLSRRGADDGGMVEFCDEDGSLDGTGREDGKGASCRFDSDGAPVMRTR